MSSNLPKLKRRFSKNERNICRICLNENKYQNKDLVYPLWENNGEDDNPLVFEALQVVVGEKVLDLKGKYSGICEMCLGLLEIAYSFKKGYHRSKSKLLPLLTDSEKSHFFESKSSVVNLYNQKNEVCNVQRSKRLKNKCIQTDTSIKNEPKDIGEEKKKPNVELISGKKSFSITDLLIVEDPPEESTEIYRGFISNLGSVISGSIVKKGISPKKENIQKANEIKPVVEIKSLIKENGNNINDSGNDDNCDDLDDYNQEQVMLPNLEVEMTCAKNGTNATEEPRCSYCKETFSKEIKIKTHELVCKYFKKFECYICKEPKQNQSRLLLHLRNKHSLGKSFIVPPEDEPAICKVCNKLCVSKDSLRYHMMRHQENLQFPCDQCGKVFASPYYTKQHVLSVHTKTINDVCTVCAKTFHYPGGLKQHMRIHRQDYKSEAKEVCPICAKTFHYSGALTYHMKTHTKEYDFQCSYCDKKSGSSSALRRHERLHTGEKPYACNFCGKAFKEVTQRLNHERSFHTGVRPHKCRVCTVAFVRKEHLRRHMCKHQGSFMCHICGNGFVDKEILGYHVKKKHNSVGKVETGMCDSDDYDYEIE